jgi:hypothetical protein
MVGDALGGLDAVRLAALLEDLAYRLGFGPVAAAADIEHLPAHAFIAPQQLGELEVGALSSAIQVAEASGQRVRRRDHDPDVVGVLWHERRTGRRAPAEAASRGRGSARGRPLALRVHR